MPNGTKPSTANCSDTTSPHVSKIFSFFAQHRLKFQFSETDFLRNFKMSFLCLLFSKKERLIQSSPEQRLVDSLACFPKCHLKL